MYNHQLTFTNNAPFFILCSEVESVCFVGLFSTISTIHAPFALSVELGDDYVYGFHWVFGYGTL